MTLPVLMSGGGGGGKGGSSGTRAAKEDPNTLRSNSIVKIINLLSWGPAYGLADQTNPAKCIYFQNTAFQNSDATYNFTGVSFEERYGDPNQSVISGYVTASQSFSVSQEVKKATPLIRTLAGPIDACRVLVGIPYLASQNAENGDLLKTTVSFKLSSRPYGTSTWTDRHVITYNDKCVSTFNESFYISLGGENDWDIKFERLTDDSTSVTLSNKTEWSAVSQLSESKFYYPNCAMVAMSLDASQFGNQTQTVAFKYRGVICRVPTNYDATAKTYSGIWDGTFKLAWTNNPAWLLYYILTEKTIGLGSIIDESTIDIYTLYAIGAYCDERVPNGYGGTEPRYTFNYQFTTSMDAYALVQIIAASFRGVAYEANGTIRFKADMPEDPIRVYTNANVIDHFQYETTAFSARHSRITVTWFDPDNMCNQAHEIVDDAEAMETYGLNETSVTAYGCTSRGLARRYGLWIHEVEKSTRTVNFQASWDSARLEPGYVIGVADDKRAGITNAFLVESSTSTSITSDRDITINFGETYTLYINCSDGTMVKRTLTNGVGVTRTLTFTTALSVQPLDGARVGISSDSAQIALFRVLSIVEKEAGTFLVSALQYDPASYGRVEQGLHLDAPVYSAYNKNKPASPVRIDFSEYLYKYDTVVKSAVTISWVPGANAVLPRAYEAQIQKTDSSWASSGEINAFSYDFKDVDGGEHIARVRAISFVGVVSDWLTVDISLFGKKLAPSDVADFSGNVLGDIMSLSWQSNNAVDFDYYVVKYSPLTSGATWQTANVLLDHQTSTTAQVPTRIGTYLIKSVNLAGTESTNPAIVVNTTSSTTALNAIAAISDYPSWDGVGSYVEVDGTTLKLQAGRTKGIYYLSMSGASGTISSSPVDVFSVEDIFGLSDIFGEIGAIDLGSSYKCQITSIVDAYGEAVGVHWEDLGLWKDLGTWGSGDPSVWSIRVELQTTQDDPASSGAAWTDWQTLVVGYYVARGFRFRLILETQNQLTIPVVQDVTINIDMPDRILTNKNITSSTGGTTISFSPPFRDISAVGITARNMATGDYFYYTSTPTKDGYTIIFKNSSDVAISRDFDYIATGYGEESV